MKQKSSLIRPILYVFLLLLLCTSLLPSGAGAAKNGFRLEDGRWTYRKKGQKLTGLQEIDGKLYAFNENGFMKTGLRRVDGCLYYFKEGEDGRAPAVTDTTVEIKGVSYHFTPTGRGFHSLGNKTADKAASMVYDMTEFSPGMTRKQKLRALFLKETSYCRYVGIPSPDLSDPDWYADAAWEMISKGRGKCYNWAALTYVLAKSLGYEARIAIGYVDSDLPGNQHGWVVVNDRYLLDASFYDSFGKEIWFFHTFDQVLKTAHKPYTELQSFPAE